MDELRFWNNKNFNSPISVLQRSYNLNEWCFFLTAQFNEPKKEIVGTRSLRVSWWGIALDQVTGDIIEIMKFVNPFDLEKNSWKTENFILTKNLHTSTRAFHWSWALPWKHIIRNISVPEKQLSWLKNSGA